MNSMGLAGVELHGVIGYNVLARFRIEYDFTADKLVFEPLAGVRPAGSREGRREGQRRHPVDGADDQDARRPDRASSRTSSIVRRGFVGIEFEEARAAVVVKKVLAGSPAEKAGFKVGDAIEESQGGRPWRAGKDLARRTGESRRRHEAHASP